MTSVAVVLRKEGISVIPYLDDWLFTAVSASLLEKHLNRTISLLLYLGWIINWNKSYLTPSRTVQFLGFVIKSSEMKTYLPQDKILKLMEAVQDIIQDLKMLGTPK